MIEAADESPEQPVTPHPRARTGSARGRNTPVVTVRDIIKSEMRHGLLPAGRQVDEQYYSVALHASRTSVREALRLLTAEGALTRKTREGTTVRLSPLQINLLGMYPAATGSDQRVSSVLVRDRQVPTPPLLAERFGYLPAEALLREYTIRMNEKPIGFRLSYRDPKHTGSGPEGAFDNLDAWFSEVFGMPIGRVETTVEYAPSDTKTSRLLDIPEQSPLLVREQIFHDAEGTTKEIAFTQIRADLVSFSYTR